MNFLINFTAWREIQCSKKSTIYSKCADSDNIDFDPEEFITDELLQGLSAEEEDFVISRSNGENAFVFVGREDAG